MVKQDLELEGHREVHQSTPSHLSVKQINDVANGIISNSKTRNDTIFVHV
jgi:hypothetical protein